MVLAESVCFSTFVGVHLVPLLVHVFLVFFSQAFLPLVPSVVLELRRVAAGGRPRQ